MTPDKKRKADHVDGRDGAKRQKQKKQWKLNRKNETVRAEGRAIQPGDSGIWATCIKGKEGRCVGELSDLFAEYEELLYPEVNGRSEAVGGEGTMENGIEDDIGAELAEMSKPTKVRLFTPMRVDMPCVVFFKTIAPVDPVALVKRICEDAMNEPTRKRTRFVKRLSPMTLMGRATEEGLEKVGREVLAPHFHQEPIEPQTFAIRPTLRNHNTLTRDGVIKLVASLVGPAHKVNLTDHDLLIVVEVYQNICGVSVLDRSFERLKRYSLAEIFDPSERTAAPTHTHTHMADSSAGTQTPHMPGQGEDAA